MNSEFECKAKCKKKNSKTMFVDNGNENPSKNLGKFSLSYITMEKT